MEQIIKITEQNGKQAVSARELYEKLGFDLSNWSKWSQKNILFNEFSLRGEDWIPIVLSTNVDNQLFNPKPSQDYSLSIDFAKKICMLARTARGEQIRNYFIECEKQLLKPRELSRSQLAQMVIDSEKEREIAEAKVKELQPKAEIFDRVMSSDDCIDIGEAARVLKLSYGRNTLFDKLRSLSILMRDNIPYQQYIQRGYFKCVESHYVQNNEARIHIKTLITQKGINWLSSII